MRLKMVNMIRLVRFNQCVLNPLTTRHFSQFKYVQGQYNPDDPKIREYFYTIDHHGQLFLDDARMKNFTSCFKDKKFLRFFFARIRPTLPQPNNIHLHFKYTSHCGPERNYTRVEATPYGFTNFQGDSSLEYNNTGLAQDFAPESLYVGSDGRLYHKFIHKHVGFALVRSAVADLISPNFKYNSGDTEEKSPVTYEYKQSTVTLDYSIKEMVENALVPVR